MVDRIPEGIAKVLVVAPIGRDAALACRILAWAGLSAETCADVETLCRRLPGDSLAGAALLTEEALDLPALQCLAEALGRQPPWSDLPLVIVTRRSGTALCRQRTLHFLESLRNVTFLERPVRIMTLVSTLRAALDARRRQREVGRLLGQLERAISQRDEFLAMLAHELRTPLAPIRNAAQVLKSAGKGEDVLWASEVVERQVHHLARLVEDLLQVSRVTRGKITLRKETLDLGVVAARAVEMVYPQFDDRRQQLTMSCPSSVQVDGDSTRLTQVVANLLENASKYTPEQGRIWLSVRREGREAILSVRDNGAGMPAEMLPCVFDPFTQGERPLDRSQGGLGIGLTLVRRLVELHGGSVAAFSAGLGLGSEFVVRLPALAEEGLPTKAPTTNGRGKGPPSRVLVVDDSRDAAESLAVLLRLYGHDVRTAHDGATALEVARGFHPQAALLDIGLPRMDGYELARRLRRESGSEILLVAVTGYGQEDARARGREAGFDAYLVKPADLGELQHLLAAKRG
jgi:signal transduction histidine kinase